MSRVITTSIAIYFLEQQAEQDLASRLDRILERLDTLEAKLSSGQARRWPQTLSAGWQAAWHVSRFDLEHAFG